MLTVEDEAISFNFGTMSLVTLAMNFPSGIMRTRRESGEKFEGNEEVK